MLSDANEFKENKIITNKNIRIVVSLREKHSHNNATNYSILIAQTIFRIRPHFTSKNKLQSTIANITICSSSYGSYAECDNRLDEKVSDN